MAKINTYYDNFFLENLIEDQYLTHLDLNQFCTVDTTMTEGPGMIKKIHKYSATDGVEQVAIGEGNTKAIVASYTEVPYEVITLQGRFAYLDEEEMRDPIIVTTGVNHLSTDMFNTTNSLIYTELKKATNIVTSTNPDFDAFVDAQALLNFEQVDQGAPGMFALVCPADMARIRKTLKDDLKYVEAFARSGYVGTVAGTNLYVSKLIEANTIVGGTREAVTVYVKKGTEVERITKGNRPSDDANIRKNWVYARKYILPALTDATKAFKITLSGSTSI